MLPGLLPWIKYWMPGAITANTAPVKSAAINAMSVSAKDAATAVKSVSTAIATMTGITANPVATTTGAE